jgi:hypothetical protein
VSGARLVHLDRDRGAAATRNAGGQAAHGCSLLFTDDDGEPDRHGRRESSLCWRKGADAAAGRTVDGLRRAARSDAMTAALP